MPIPRIRPPRPLAVALAVSLAALAPLPAAAQSLIQLYDAAHAYDASYLAARALYESAPYRVDQTRALLRPNVSLGANAGEVKAYLDNSPNPHNTSYGVTITGRQPILNKPNSTTIAQSERSLVSSLAELDAAEQDLMLRVSQAYFDVLGAQDTLATTRASKAAISEQLASAKRNFEVGTATITDTREAQARFDLATAQEIAAENDLRTKRIALDQLVGQSNVAPRQLRVPVVLPVPKSDVEEYVSRAADGHPSVRRALVAYEVAQLETEKARAQSLPTVDAVASVGNGRGLFQPGLFGQNTSIGVQLNMPIFAGGAIQNRIKETLVLEERARNDLAAARRGVTQTTRQA